MINHKLLHFTVDLARIGPEGKQPSIVAVLDPSQKFRGVGSAGLEELEGEGRRFGELLASACSVPFLHGMLIALQDKHIAI